MSTVFFIYFFSKAKLFFFLSRLFIFTISLLIRFLLSLLKTPKQLCRVIWKKTILACFFNFLLWLPHFALFWGKFLISPFLLGSPFPNLGNFFQNTYVLSRNVAFLVYALLGKFPPQKCRFAEICWLIPSLILRCYCI